MQGEEQKKLDVLSNDIMVNSLRACGKVALMVSEENVSHLRKHKTKQNKKTLEVFQFYQLEIGMVGGAHYRGGSKTKGEILRRF